ncbi:hypothetical protein [Streptomyces qaidamensis]|uniref:hypothetical protein n=1 Tax=Streptomyces qaidamensis TaxID=1783515 RepID=UPI000D185A90|nr:hypothetical protein [Streptomyces qaidamensis]
MPDNNRSLVRFFITLPDPFPVPDGYIYKGAPVVPEPYASRSMNHLFVHLRFMQSRNTSRRHGSFSSAAEAIKRLGQVADDDSESMPSNLDGNYTTVIATTLSNAEIASDDEWMSPQDVPIEHDALNRCIYTLQEVIRAYRAAFEVPCTLPSYELLDIFIPFQTTQSVVMTQEEEGFSLDSSEWGPVNALMLDHVNIPDVTDGPEISQENIGRLEFFENLRHAGAPLFVWRERFVEAHRALKIEGQYGAAVTLSNTASEVLLDSLLATLLWEAGNDAEDVAEVFAEGRLARRVKSQFASLLGGKWTLDGNTPVAEWFHRCYRLRHRVVHGGYSPTRLEAQTALESVHSLSSYCWDRLAAKRKSSPRTALLFLGEEGLRRRNKWCSFMQHFSSDVAPHEDSWLRQSQKWRDDVQAKLMSSE